MWKREAECGETDKEGKEERKKDGKVCRMTVEVNHALPQLLAWTSSEGNLSHRNGLQYGRRYHNIDNAIILPHRNHQQENNNNENLTSDLQLTYIKLKAFLFLVDWQRRPHHLLVTYQASANTKISKMVDAANSNRSVIVYEQATQTVSIKKIGELGKLRHFIHAPSFPSSLSPLSLSLSLMLLESKEKGFFLQNQAQYSSNERPDSKPMWKSPHLIPRYALSLRSTLESSVR